MRNLEATAGSAAWAIVAILMILAALQPVDVSASGGGSGTLIALCADGSTALAMGCDSIHL